MAGNHGANQYRQTAVTTANRGQILIMLYEAAIRNTKKAIISMDKNDRASKGIAICKTHDIINELLTTLNFEVGGDIARELERLYIFVIEQLVKANVDNAKEPLLSVQKILETLLVAWREAVAQVNKGAQPPQP